MEIVELIIVTFLRKKNDLFEMLSDIKPKTTCVATVREMTNES